MFLCVDIYLNDSYHCLYNVFIVKFFVKCFYMLIYTLMITTIVCHFQALDRAHKYIVLFNLTTTTYSK